MRLTGSKNIGLYKYDFYIQYDHPPFNTFANDSD